MNTTQTLKGEENHGFRFAPWLIGIVLICLAPLVLLILGVDFSTGVPSLVPGAVAMHSVAELGDAAYYALRGSFTHTILEWTAVCMAIMVATLAFVQFRISHEPSLPIIGIALACAGAMDAFHTLSADRLIQTVADNRNLIPFTWAICRLFNALIMVVGVGLFVFSGKALHRKGSHYFVPSICLGLMVAAYLIIHACATSTNLPQTMFPQSWIKRPYDLYPLIPYLICGLYIFPTYHARHPTFFAKSLILSIIPQIATQLYMAFGSYNLHDSCFNIAHALKAVAYLVPMLGLMLGYIHSYQNQIHLVSALKKRKSEATLLQKITIVVTQASSFDDALQNSIEEICKSLGWPIGHVYLRTSSETESLVSTNIWFFSDPEKFEPFRVATNQTNFECGVGLPGRVLATRKPQWIADVQTDESFIRTSKFPHFRIGGAFAFPIELQGKIEAVLEFFYTEPVVPDENFTRNIQMLAGQLSTVLERARATDELRQNELNLSVALQELETQKLALDEHALVSIANLKGNIIFVNKKFCDISGYSEAELVNSNHRIIKSDEHDDVFFTNLWKTISQGRVWRGEIKNRRKDGSHYWVSTTIVPFKDQSGKISKYVSIRTDITESKSDKERYVKAISELQDRSEELEIQQRELTALNKHLEEAQAKALTATQVKSDFLAHMSHEIRTPMTAILGFVETLRDEGDLDLAPKSRIEAIDTIQRNGEYLLNLINDILDISKIEADKMTVESIQCSPHEIITDVIELMRGRSEAKNLSLNMEYIGPVPETILCDPIRFKQILVNIIGNAIKFTDKGSVRIITRFVQHETNPSLQMDIVDTGPGITKEQKLQLFRAFTQADGTMTRKFGGTGLGLTISKYFAEMLGGDITIIDTKPGNGTCFRTTIATGLLDGVRMIDDFSSETRSKSTKKTATTPSDVLHNCRILFAEDGIDNQRLVSYILKKVGAIVTIANNGQIAFDEAMAAMNKGESYDVILMDMQMPVMDGYEATRQLRQNHYQGPIIALTAHAMSDDREKCLEAGCDDYATKPIDQHKLITQIDSYYSRGDPTMASPSDKSEALISELADDTAMAELIELYVSELPDRITAFQKALEDHDLNALASLAHQLKGSAGGYGFPAISEAAQLVEEGANIADDLTSLAEQTKVLTDLCLRARANAVSV